MPKTRLHLLLLALASLLAGCTDWETAPDSAVLEEGWQYSWGEEGNWHAYDFESPPENSSRSSLLLLRSRLPATRYADPCLFIRDNDLRRQVEFYVDGRMIHGSGPFTPEASNRFLSLKWHIIALDDSHLGKPVVLHIYSDQPSDLGLRRPPILGSQRQVLTRMVRRYIDYLVLGSIFLFLGLASLLVYVRYLRLRLDLALSFGLMTLTTGLYTVLSSDFVWLLTDAVGAVAWASTLSLLLFLVGLYGFREKVSGAGLFQLVRRAKQAHLVFAALFLPLFAFDLLPIGQLERAFYLLASASMAVLFFEESRVLFSKESPRALRLVAVGGLLFLAFALHDVLRLIGLDVPPGRGVFHWGLLLYILALSDRLIGMVESDRRELEEVSGENEKKTRDLAKSVRELEKANTNLEQRVAERTRSLKESNLSLIELNEALVESETTSRQLVDNILVGLIVHNEGIIIEANREMCKILGKSSAELIGRSVDELFEAGSREHFQDDNEAELRAPFEGSMIRDDGSEVAVEVISKPISYKGWNVRVLAIRDISERQKVIGELKKAKEEAERANRAKSEFLANMSHEIRTPMNAVIGFTDILGASLTDPQQRSYLNSIKSAGKSLLMLINDILDLSKIEAGRLDIVLEPVNPTQLLREVTEVFALKIKEKNLNFIQDIDPGMPQGLLLDPARMRQILFNLIGNAVKFTEQGFIRVHAFTRRLDGLPPSVELVVRVEDSGIGIPAEHHQKIFSAFRQQENRVTRKHSGTGLGLTISKRLADMLEGRIDLESEPGKGSCFSLVLERVPVELAPEAEAEQPPRAIRFEPARVLVVDDIEDNRMLIRGYFIGTPIVVREAEDGVQALEAIAHERPDLVLMDLRMPEMDGHEAVRMIKSKPDLAGLPVIAMTASVLVEEKERIAQSGFDGFLRKPTQKEDLFAELSRHLPHQKVAAKATQAKERAGGGLRPDQQDRLPALLRGLDELQAGLWPRAQRSNRLQDIKLFAQRLEELGTQNGFEPLVGFAQKMAFHASNFDIEQTGRMIKQYPLLLEDLRAQLPNPMDN